MFSKRYLGTFKRFKHKWVTPEGHDTGINVYNCVTRDKQPLIVKNRNLVTWYTCGPTVYDSSHIGHASCFLKLDIIQRILRQHFRLNLVTAMNITDVDDKIIARSNSLQVPVEELVKNFEKEFWNDMNALGINKPNCVLRVTENMEIIKKFVQKLMDDNKAYLAKDSSVYFDVAAYENYGKLQTISEATPEVAKFKKSSMDFALWKAAKPNEVYWRSPWGDGRPGWHIECSALASYIFGPEIDIHAGGIDLRFPHHENEEAQSCQVHNRGQWVNYWLHTGHLHLRNSEKMSKSLKNTISVDALLEDAKPSTFRLACLMSHYRSSMEYSSELMATAAGVLQNYVNFIDVCRNYVDGLIRADVNCDAVNELVGSSVRKIDDALRDDFNTPLVIKVLNDVVSTVNSVLHSSRTDRTDCKSVTIVSAANLLSHTLGMFGIDLITKRESASDRNFVEAMNILNEFRQDVRQIGVSTNDRNLLELCDNVRSNLNKIGITIKDHGKLSSWS